MLFARGAMLLKSDGYAKRKQTASQNTILVNGNGQRGSLGGVWTQPLRGVDMASLATMFPVVHLPDGGAIVQGEAGRMYEYRPRVPLATFRRILVWLPGAYALAVDHVRAPEPVEVTWLAQSRQAEAAGGRFRLGDGAAVLDGALASSTELATIVVDSPADDRGKALGYRQVRSAATGREVVVAALFDPWRKGSIQVAVEGGAVVVSGPFGTDRWQIAVPDPAEPAAIRGERNGTPLTP